MVLYPFLIACEVNEYLSFMATELQLHILDITEL